MKTSDLMRKQGKPQLFVDGESIVREQKKVILAGWAVGTTPVSLQVYDENKKPVKITLKRNTRMDVAEMFRECEVNKDSISRQKMYLERRLILLQRMRTEKRQSTRLVFQRANALRQKPAFIRKRQWRIIVPMAFIL